MTNSIIDKSSLDTVSLKDGGGGGSGVLVEKQLHLQDRTINLTMQQIREQKT